jgi:hypothetical protein
MNGFERNLTTLEADTANTSSDMVGFGKDPLPCDSLRLVELCRAYEFANVKTCAPCRLEGILQQFPVTDAMNPSPVPREIQMPMKLIH